MGNFRKIFAKSEEQFQEYRKFYDFAQELYSEQNRLIGTSTNFSTYYYIPFIKNPRQDSPKKRKEKRDKSMIMNQNYEQKKNAVRSIETRKITSAKSSSKRVVISTKNLHEEKKGEKKIVEPQMIYFDENEVVFNNTNIKEVFTKKKKKKLKSPVKKEE